MTQLSVWPKVIKRTVNKLRTSWQLPTKIDLHFPPSLLFLWPFFLFALPCRLSPFLPSSSLFGLLQKVDSFPLYKNCVYYCFICPLILFSFLFSHTTIHLAPKAVRKAVFFLGFITNNYISACTYFPDILSEVDDNLMITHFWSDTLLTDLSYTSQFNSSAPSFGLAYHLLNGCPESPLSGCIGTKYRGIAYFSRLGSNSVSF